MATWDIGDTGTAGNNVDNNLANFGSFASALADAGVTNGDTLRCVRAVDLSGGSAFTISKNVTITSHDDCAINDVTYSAVTSKARSEKTITVSATVTIEKIGVVHASGSGIVFDTGDCTVRRCGFYGGSGNDSLRNFSGTALTATVSNCFFIGASGQQTLCYLNGSATVNMYHCSGYSGTGTYGVYEAGSAVVSGYATVFMAAPGANARYNGVAGDYNVSSDTSAPGSSSTKYARSEVDDDWVTNLTATTQDFELPAARQGWWAANKDAIDQTGWPADVATDIVGTSRSSDIDPGVWQTPAAAATTYPWRLLLLGVG